MKSDGECGDDRCAEMALLGYFLAMTIGVCAGGAALVGVLAVLFSPRPAGQFNDGTGLLFFLAVAAACIAALSFACARLLRQGLDEDDGPG
jgi:hypothetical protein